MGRVKRKTAKFLRGGHSALVSIIVATYNRPEMLNCAIKSVVDQTYKNVEIVVVNDGGEDVSDVIDQYKRMGRIVYFALENGKGTAGARNYGLKRVKGKYVGYLDDDDLYLPEHIETVVSALETSSYEVAYSDAYRVTQDSFGGKNVSEEVEVPFSEDFSRERLLVCNYIPMLTLMHKRCVLERTGMFDEELNILEDWDLLIRLSREVSFCHIPKATCKFTVRLGDAGHVNSSFARQLRGFKFVYEKHPVDNPEILRGRIEMLNRLKKEAVKADVC